jgi:hypothetical protein
MLLPKTAQEKERAKRKSRDSDNASMVSTLNDMVNTLFDSTYSSSSSCDSSTSGDSSCSSDSGGGGCCGD